MLANIMQGLYSNPASVKETLPITSTWLGRHAKWVHKKSSSHHTLERLCAKIWAVVFTVILGISLIFLPQAFQFQNFLSQLQSQKSDQIGDFSEPGIIKDYLDGGCDHFFNSTLFKPYLDQLKFIFNQQTFLKTQINELMPSPFKARMLELYQHLNHSQSNLSNEANRDYYVKFLGLLRACRKEVNSINSQTDGSFILVRNFLDKFIQCYMKETVFYEKGMKFLYSRGLSKDLSINKMSDIGDALEKGLAQLGNNTCSGNYEGLFDPNLLGNIPYQTFELLGKNGKTISVFRCANLAKDEKRVGNKLIEATAGEQFTLFLDACQREGKKHFYVNMMKRNLAGHNETVRSEVIENLENDYPDVLNVVSLDRNSPFYFQSGSYQFQDSAVFKGKFKEHLKNDELFFWSKKLDKQTWTTELDVMIEEIHSTYFQSTNQLNYEQRLAYIELTYCMIIDTLIAKFEPDSCNFSCKSCIDRGGLTNAIMYLYYLIKKQGIINPDQFNYLLYLTFLPALLVGNRQIQPEYLKRLVNFARVFMGSNQHVAKPLPQNDYIQDIIARKTTTIFDQQQPKAPFDTLKLSIEEQINWRGENFVTRKKLPTLSIEQRNEIESRYSDKLPAIQKLIEERIKTSGISLEEDDVKSKIIETVSKHYLLTMQYYSPVIVKWMDSLLQRDDDKKLIFLARDGIIFHEVANNLLERFPERYPNMTKDKLVIAWLSRKSSEDAASRGNLVERYFKQLGIEPNDSLVLVDTGCTGSIKRAIAPLIKNELECQFSVSRNPSIHGFWDNCDFSLQALAFVKLPIDHEDAWANDPKNANDWVEDTHRGNFIGANKLVEENGVIHPYPSMEWINDGKKNHLATKETTPQNAIELSDFLVRELGRQAIMDFANEISITDNELNYDAIKLNFNDLLTRIQKGEIECVSCKHD